MKKELVKPIAVVLKIAFIVYIVLGALMFIGTIINLVRTANGDALVIVIGIITALIMAGIIAVMCYFLYKAHEFFARVERMNEEEVIENKQKIANWSVALLFLLLPIGAVSLIYYHSIPSV